MTDAPQATPEEPLRPLAARQIRSRSTLMDLCELVVVALAVALAVRSFVFQPFDIPSKSMEATLRVGDYVFTEKFAYGYSRFSLPFGSALPSFGRVFAEEPRRGDVVVFALPSDPKIDFIKRVIGLPGDHIQLIGGVVYINDVPVAQERVAAFSETGQDGQPHRIAQYRETLPDGQSYLVLYRASDWPEDTTGVYTVPPGHYFMLGDNRDDSDDSRGIVGYVPIENLIGKAQFTILSVDDNEISWWKFWTWPDAFRAGRFFARID